MPIEGAMKKNPHPTSPYKGEAEARRSRLVMIEVRV
jgi:hypothetical protein